MPTISFVIPVKDEEAVLPELHRRLDAVARDIQGDTEFILVDDGSADRSREVMSELRARDERVKLIFLARNFGHQLALSAGLDFATGDAIVIIDGDLQDPPEVVLEMIPLWREGYEVVHAIRRRRAGESRMKLWTAKWFYRLMHRLSDVDFPVDSGDFRLVDRRVADVVRSMREPDRYLRGMFAWVGFRQTNVSYDRDERFAGKTKNSWRSMISFAIDGILGFSVAPLRFILGLGFVISALSMAVGVVAIVLKVAGSLPPVQGWASLTVLVSFLAGIQLIVLGTIGLYVARAYEQGKNRPLYLIASAEGLEAGPSGPLREHGVLSSERQPTEPTFDPSQ
ncbi:MAG: polyisoprenyl-phosphate glycosyltransferase [Solirubrobacterales bacterium]|jgi:dolichol-phosphate mannosyltransferase|nr:polyisoprenyl-phosphate glycosyltransferase [Solirubrobacterales bacterium]